MTNLTTKNASSPPTPTASQNEDEDEELSRKILEICERAYADGITSADIYSTLHSPQILFPSSQEISSKTSKNNCKISHKTKEQEINQISRLKAKQTSTSKISDHLKYIKKVFLVIISLTFLAIVAHLTVCKLLRVNPLKIVNLQEKRCLLPSHPLIMEMVRPVANCSICQPLTFDHKESEGILIKNVNLNNPLIELSGIPSKEFFRKIAYAYKPIIIRQGAFAKNAKAFDFAKLKALFESEVKGVDTVSEECQFLPFRSPFSSLRDAFDRIGSNKESFTSPWYIGWSNCHPGVASKLREIVPRPIFIPDGAESSAIDWVFIGSPGLGAAMHIDYVRRPSWQAQLSGIKTWHLRPPPECEDICPPIVSFTINPGDLVFLETNTWYHQTFIEGNTLSISIGSEYD